MELQEMPVGTEQSIKRQRQDSTDDSTGENQSGMFSDSPPALLFSARGEYTLGTSISFRGWSFSNRGAL